MVWLGGVKSVVTLIVENGLTITKNAWLSTKKNISENGIENTKTELSNKPLPIPISEDRFSTRYLIVTKSLVLSVEKNDYI
jgi:hypothetical protein